MATNDRRKDKDERARAANRKANMGPGEVGGGYAGQHYDSQPLEGGHMSPNAERQLRRGRQHMSGVYGDKAFGRVSEGDTSRPAQDSGQEDDEN